MSGPLAVGIWTGAALVLLCGGVITAAFRDRTGADVYSPSTRPRSERAAQTVWTHAGPPRPFAVPQARRTMQLHRECAIEECPRKRAALRALVEAGLVKPDSRRPAYARSLA